MSVPVIINCRDRLAPLRLLVEYLERAGQEEIVLLDNDSAYPPLLDYLAESPHRVVRLGHNAGHLAPWTANVLADLGITGRFVFTDPDVVPDESCPLDAIEYFGEILDAYPDREKAGFGLRIDDLPATYPHRAKVERWEAQWWQKQLAPRLFDADIDTTFALYRAPTPHRYRPAARTGYPYLARHLTWYLDEGALPDEERFYREHARRDVANWSQEELPDWLEREIAALDAEGPLDHRLDLGGAGSLTGGMLLAAGGWAGEPPPVDERENTPWAEPGWHSWNDMSVEVELCELLAAFAAVLRPERVIETGTGQGFLARRLKGALGPGQVLTCFESDQAWREALATLAFFDDEVAVLSGAATPSEDELARADLTCLDSDIDYRLAELERWWSAAAPGATVFVHDAGNGHSPDTIHSQVRDTIVRLGIPGCFLANPRGAFIGVIPDPSAKEPQADLIGRLEVAERELNALRDTKTFRYTRRPRLLYQSLRRVNRSR
jgi:hypothetical protein